MIAGERSYPLPNSRRMKSFFAQVHIDGRPVYETTVTTNQPWTAANVALRDAIRLKKVKHRAYDWSVKLKKLKPVKV